MKYQAKYFKKIGFSESYFPAVGYPATVVSPSYNQYQIKSELPRWQSKYIRDCTQEYIFRLEIGHTVVPSLRYYSGSMSQPGSRHISILVSFQGILWQKSEIRLIDEATQR